VINTHEQHEFWEMYDLLRQALMRGGRFVSAVQDEDLEFLESVLRGDWSARARSHFLAALAEGDAGLTESVGAAACLGGWRAVEGQKYNRDLTFNMRYEIDVGNKNMDKRLASIAVTGRKEVNVKGNYSRYNSF
jgi:hypothetical protein